jgi:methyltransferase (TIGR00027 family)
MKMLPEQPSRTLLRTAIRRAAHQIFDTPTIFSDPIAVGLVPEASEHSIRAAASDHAAPVPTLLRSLSAMRSRFAEDRLADAVASGARQYVIVGAGLDTFPWRQPTFAHDIQIFYADHPTTLAWTRERIRERGLSMPSNLTFVTVDLEEDQLGKQLRDFGFEPKAGTFCSTLGVVQYLSRDAVERLFHFPASLTPPSEIVFSFVPPDDELDGDDLAAATQAVVLTEALGEPWKSRFHVSDLIDLLVRAGFRDVFHLTPEVAQQRYFAERRDMLKAHRLEQLIAARRADDT